MKLTIGMIVKNEEKYLERCLDSIKPILDKVESELIITDTGSTDRTVSIAKKYTANVRHYDWTDDFSAARNTTVEGASGEWYMFVDGDDIFESCDDIIGFFNSGEYKNYNCASFIYRNITDLQNNLYNDQNVIRMTVRTADTRFIGRIHEVLSPLSSPVREIKDIVDHYGYLYDSDENTEKDKSGRNEKLLLKELEETPETDGKYCYLYHYLFEALRISDPEKAEEYLDNGIKKAQELKSPAIMPMIMNKVGVLFPARRFDELVGLCDKYFAEIRDSGEHLTVDSEMYAAKALSLANLGRENEAIPAFGDFFRAFDAARAGISDDPDRFTTAPVLAGDMNYLNVVLKFMASCITADRLYEMMDLLTKTDLSRYSFKPETVSVIVENEIALLSNIGYENAARLYANLDTHGKTVFRNSLCNVLFIEKEKDGILSALDGMCADDPKLSDKLKIYRAYFIDKAVSEDDICAFAEKYGTQDNHDLLCIMMQCGMDISRLSGIKDFDPIVAVKRCCDYVSGTYNAAEKYGASYIADASALPKAVKIYEYIMKCAINANLPINALMDVYTGMAESFAERMPSGSEPPEITAALIIGEAQKYRKQRKFKECFAEMKKAVETYPNISPVIAAYRDTVSAELDGIMSGKTANTEMEKLALTLKNNIRKLIGRGDIASARKILSEYAAINPNDPEIAELESMMQE